MITYVLSQFRHLGKGRSEKMYFGGFNLFSAFNSKSTAQIVNGILELASHGLNISATMITMLFLNCQETGN